MKTYKDLNTALRYLVNTYTQTVGPKKILDKKHSESTARGANSKLHISLAEGTHPKKTAIFTFSVTSPKAAISMERKRVCHSTSIMEFSMPGDNIRVSV